MNIFINQKKLWEKLLDQLNASRDIAANQDKINKKLILLNKKLLKVSKLLDK